MRGQPRYAISFALTPFSSYTPRLNHYRYPSTADAVVSAMVHRRTARLHTASPPPPSSTPTITLAEPTVSF